VAIFWASCMVPHGPGMGCHVAPVLVMVCKRFMEFVGIEPRTSHKVQHFCNVSHSGTCYVMV
jgi:hypothetical protein